MEKKVIALGPKDRKSFNVTLPIEWVRSQSIQKNKLVDLEIVGNSAVVRPFKIEQERVLLDAEELPNSLMRFIAVLYKKGVDEIKIINVDSKIINKISKFIEEHCIGFEIIDQSKDYCIIQDIARQSKDDFQTLLRRCFILTMQLSEESDTESIENLDKSLNKLTAYCQRLLIKQGYSEFSKVSHYMMLCMELEHIGDEYKRAYTLGEKIGKEINNLLRRTYDLFYKFSFVSCDALQKITREVSGKTYYERTIIRRINSLMGIIISLKS